MYLQPRPAKQIFPKNSHHDGEIIQSLELTWQQEPAESQVLIIITPLLKTFHIYSLLKLKVPILQPSIPGASLNGSILFS